MLSTTTVSESIVSVSPYHMVALALPFASLSVGDDGTARSEENITVEK